MKQLSIIFNSKNINSVFIDGDSHPDAEKAISIMERAIIFLRNREKEELEKQALNNILQRAKKLKW
jgi:hypothetical protein